jgi:hypothetical protein
MKKFLNKIFAIDLYAGKPLRYHESQFTIAELEKRLIAEVNGYRK